jgi:hypothetical protein
MKKIAILASITAFLLGLAGTPALAQASGFLDMSNQEGFNQNSGDIPGAFGQSADQPTDVRTIVARLIKIVLTFLAIIFVVLVVYGGFKWMTAAGNEGQVDDAKKIITQATIGLIVLLSAYGLTVFIFDVLLKATGAVDSNMFD